jgi:flagellin
MSMSINTNIVSMNAQRNLAASQGSLATSMQRLSSGLRVNSAADDAAGLAIASRMDAQVRGMDVAARNANDGISMAQTADGAMGQIGDMLQRMRELAVQGANGSNNVTDSANLDAEFQQLGSEINRTVGSTSFNGNAILGAAAAVGFTFQVGANTTANDTVTVKGVDLSAAASKTNIATTKSLTTAANATAAITAIDAAVDEITTQRATWGATQNRFNSIVSTLQVGSQNQASARSRIMDADFAKETSNLSRAQILQQAGNAMVAQANQLPNGVMALLKG